MTKRWSEETEQLVAEALWAACFVPPRGAGTTIGQPPETCREDARGALAALADAGLLVPPSATTREQTGVYIPKTDQVSACRIGEECKHADDEIERERVRTVVTFRMPWRTK